MSAPVPDHDLLDAILSGVEAHADDHGGSIEHAREEAGDGDAYARGDLEQILSFAWPHLNHAHRFELYVAARSVLGEPYINPHPAPAIEAEVQRRLAGAQ